MQVPILKKLAATLTILIAACPSVFAFTTPAENILVSDGTSADTQAAINAAADGATIQLPSGVFTWGSPVRMAKAVKLRGNGAGRVILRSLSTMTIGTGSKTFSVALDRYQNRLPIVGETIRVQRLGFRTQFMEGTVTSYAAGSLVVDVTSKSGSGTYMTWIAGTLPSTTVIHGTGNTPMFDITSSAAGPTEITEIRFQQGTNSGNDGYQLALHGTPSNATMLLHDLFFDVDASQNGANASGFVSIRSTTCNVVLYNSSFNQAAQGGPIGVHIQEQGEDSWAMPDTMGTRDTDGKRNFYIENCDFHYSGATDFDDFARVVVRRNTFNNSYLSSHGADTSNVGMRHAEVYENEFVFDNRVGLAPNILSYFFMRGGTAVITDNIWPPLISQDWGDKPDIFMTVLNLWRNYGPYACWGNGNPGPSGAFANLKVTSVTAGDPALVTVSSEHRLTTGDRVRFHSDVTGVTPNILNSSYAVTVVSPTTFTIPVNVTTGITGGVGYAKPINYPAPHQQGTGHDGTAQIFDPIYVWNNTTDGSTPYSIPVSPADDASGNTCGAYADSVADYIQIGRDVITDGTAKPRYTKYTYPHPARDAVASFTRPSPPSNLRVNP